MNDAPELTDIDKIREAIKVLEGMTGSRGDDHFVRETQEAFERLITQLHHSRRLLQEVVDDMIFSVAPNKGTVAKIEELLAAE